MLNWLFPTPTLPPILFPYVYLCSYILSSTISVLLCLSCPMVFPPQFLFCNTTYFSSFHIILLFHFFLHHHLHLCHERHGGQMGIGSSSMGKTSLSVAEKSNTFINTAEWIGRNQASFWKWAAERQSHQIPFYCRGSGRKPCSVMCTSCW